MLQKFITLHKWAILQRAWDLIWIFMKINSLEVIFDEFIIGFVCYFFSINACSHHLWEDLLICSFLHIWQQDYSYIKQFISEPKEDQEDTKTWIWICVSLKSDYYFQNNRTSPLDFRLLILLKEWWCLNMAISLICSHFSFLKMNYENDHCPLRA